MTKLLSLRGLILATLLLAPPLLWAHGISAEDRQRMLDGGNLQFVGLGASHMLTGYDHLLFLFGVVFFLTTFKEVVKFVTVFTLGHCITLIFATFYGWRSPGKRWPRRTRSNSSMASAARSGS